MPSGNNNPVSDLLELCKDITDHVKLLRDYAATPGNVWMARDELARIQTLLARAETLMDEIKAESQ